METQLLTPEETQRAKDIEGANACLSLLYLALGIISILGACQAGVTQESIAGCAIAFMGVHILILHSRRKDEPDNNLRCQYVLVILLLIGLIALNGYALSADAIKQGFDVEVLGTIHAPISALMLYNLCTCKKDEEDEEVKIISPTFITAQDKKGCERYVEAFVQHVNACLQSRTYLCSEEIPDAALAHIEPRKHGKIKDQYKRQLKVYREEEGIQKCFTYDVPFIAEKDSTDLVLIGDEMRKRFHGLNFEYLPASNTFFISMKG